MLDPPYLFKPTVRSTVAHRGALLLDEWAEFGCLVLEAVLQSPEDGVVSLGRAHGTITCPARFTLVGALTETACALIGKQGHVESPGLPHACPEPGGQTAVRIGDVV